jgi:hypothetical protein
MAKRGTKPPAPEPDEINEALTLLAEMLLSEHFFDPDLEQIYKKKLSANRPAGTAGVVLEEDTIALPDGDCVFRIEALRTWTHFRIGFSHQAFTASVEGSWNFKNEDLQQVTVTRTGDPDAIIATAEGMMEAIEGDDLDDEEFASFMDGLADEDDDEVPMIGDDPTEPSEATALDRGRVKAIAKRFARKPDADFNLEDQSWLEQTPQTLPVITEILVDLCGAAKRDEASVSAYQVMLTMQLEFVRYRQDRGWAWADDMLAAFQERLITLGIESAIPRDDWFMMCNAMIEARVPVPDTVQVALAEAGFTADEESAPPDELMRTLRGFLDDLARMVSSPFEVIHSLRSAGAMLPAMLRGFMATELALSPHPVLREAVPLLLLDDDATVRRNAAAALEQTAHPDTMSPDTLRRAITLRNWIPAADRPALDAAIRKGRLAGVTIGVRPVPAPDLEFHASVVDGSAAQSILMVSRSGKTNFFGGLLLRHGTGVVDTWADADLSSGKINKLLREAQTAAATVRVGTAFVDTVVQHAIGTALALDTVPPAMVLELAEIVGGTEWKDRRLDIKAEAEQLFEALDPADRTPKAVKSGLAKGATWIAKEPAFSSWFEDGPGVQKALAKLPRTDQIGMTAVVMTEILPGKRADWAERFLVMALWSQAATDAKQQARAVDLALIAHALVGDGPIAAIPAMAVIARQTVRAMLLGGW